MIDYKIDIKISPNLKPLLDQPEEVMRKSLWAGMIHLVREIEGRAKKEAPVQSSNLVNMITSDVSRDGLLGTVTSGAKYSEYVHFGTGIFGPFKQKIVPRTKKALFWPGARHPVKSVKGRPPNPFFDRALKQINPQSVFEDGMMSFLAKFGDKRS